MKHLRLHWIVVLRRSWFADQLAPSSEKFASLQTIVLFFLRILILHEWCLRQIAFFISEEGKGRFGGSKLVFDEIGMCAQVKISTRACPSIDSNTWRAAASLRLISIVNEANFSRPLSIRRKETIGHCAVNPISRANQQFAFVICRREEKTLFTICGQSWENARVSVHHYVLEENNLPLTFATTVKYEAPHFFPFWTSSETFVSRNEDLIFPSCLSFRDRFVRRMSKQNSTERLSS